MSFLCILYLDTCNFAVRDKKKNKERDQQDWGGGQAKFIFVSDTCKSHWIHVFICI